MSPTRNIYENGVDFAALALQSPDFAKQLSHASQVSPRMAEEAITDITFAYIQREEQSPARFQ